ncbi:MAG TPA: ABC transporter permease [Pseudonocardiaceae bacterium]|jgi:ABC-type nitrate/sulfonate/bicarbonate transport system permease component|nr:ABC transporter permease [Pseudonocardiaceae bacterium]
MTTATPAGPVEDTGEAPAAGAASLGRRVLRSVLSRWLVFVLLVLVWQLLTARIQSPFFPTPLTIVGAAGKMWFSGPAGHLFVSDAFVANVLPSIARMLGGWLLAVIVGVAIGIGLGRSQVALDYASPVLNFLRSIPPPTLVPVFLVLLDIGTMMQLTVIVIGVIWPVLLNTIDGARSVDQVKVEMVRAFHISRPQWIFGVIIPAALPKIFAGLRVSLSMALIMMVLSELFGSTNGIGFELQFSQESFDLPGMWACILLLGVLGYLANRALLAIEKRALGWHNGARQNAAG